MSTIEINSIDDIDTALDLIEEAQDAFASLIMPLPPDKQFEETYGWRGGWRTATITHAYSNACYANGRWISSSLDEEEGYYSTSGITEGQFIHATPSREVLKTALVRFFSTDDFSEQRVDPLTSTVIPVQSYL